MYKIAITGKANVGKNTLSKLLHKEMSRLSVINCEYLAFADPIKKIIKIMFPDVPDRYLSGSSKFRSEIIPNAFKDGHPLTIRQLLIDLGTGVGKSYNENIWINILENSVSKAINNHKNMIIVTDVRFRNEFDYLKKNGFFLIKLTRDNNTTKINHISELNQDSIKDNEYDCIINNNGTLKDLRNEVHNLIIKLK